MAFDNQIRSGETRPESYLFMTLIDLCFNFLASLQSQREMELASGSSLE